MKKLLSLLMCAVMVMSFVVSASALKSVPVKSIKLDKSSITLSVGKTYDLKVAFKPANTTQKLLKYSTSNKNIAAVDAKGKITAVKAGKAVIIVTSSSNNKVSTSCNVTVSQAAKKVPPAKLTMFMTDSGVATPDDFNATNNPYIKEICRIANVELKVTRPLYADFRDKFTLMLSSGNIPDIVHSMYLEDINNTGMAGGFLPLNDYVAKSKVLSKFQSKDIINAKKASDGKLYGYPARAGKNPNFLLARIDLIEQVNGGNIPKTPEDWYNFAKNLKKAYPDSIPISSQGEFGRMDQFFTAYGVDIFSGIKIENGKVVKTLDSPNMKRAVEFHRKLYAEGLIDANFVNNKWPDMQVALYEKNSLCRNSNAIELQYFMGDFAAKGMKSKSLGAVPMPVAEGVSPVFYENTTGSHMLSIGAKCKDADAAIRVIEAFCSPEVIDLGNWGIKGADYKIENGKKKLILPAAEKSSYRQMYNFMIEFYNDDAFDITWQVLQSKITDLKEKEYMNRIWNDSMKVYKEDYVPYLQVNPFQLFQLDPEISKKYMSDYAVKARSIIEKAVVGHISMDEFSSEAKKLADETFGDGVVLGEYQKYYNSLKK